MKTTQPGKPKHQRLTEQLRRDMKSGALRIGDRLPSFAEMKERQGASQATMERVYAQLEQEGLISRQPGRGTFVQSVIGDSKFGDTKNRAAATHLLGFIGADFIQRHSSVYSASLVSGIQSAAARADRQILLLDADSTQGLEKVDGVLICSTRHSESILRRLPPGLSGVALLAEINGMASVVADDREGARQAVRHLVSLGHTRIACLMETVAPLPRLRYQGYRDALRESKISFETIWVRRRVGPKFETSDYRSWGREQMQNWLQENWREANCTALLAQNDLTALGALQALQEAGIKVPRDVSVIGFDGTAVCDYAAPMLSAVAMPLEEIGSQAVAMLLEQIEALDGGVTPQKIVLPTSLKTGASTAARKK